MRKFISIILLLAMICGLFACRAGGKTSAPSAQYTSKDLMLYQATRLAQLLSQTADSDYLKAMGAGGQVIKQAQVFAAASSLENLTSGLLLRLDDKDLPALIYGVSKKTGTADQLTCSSMLSFSTQFYSSLSFPQQVGVHLSYGKNCHVIVLFESQQDQLVRATIFPIFAAVSEVLISQQLKDHTSYSREGVMSACNRASQATLAAPLTGNTVSAAYYSGLAKQALADVKPAAKEDLLPFVSDTEVIIQVGLFTKQLANTPASTKVYHFPTGLGARNSLYMQQAYLSWGNTLSGKYGQVCSSANAVLMRVLGDNTLGTAAQEGEVPVLVAIDYGSITAIVTIYPNEYNTYLYHVVCLPCSFADANLLLASEGASPME